MFQYIFLLGNGSNQQVKSKWKYAICYMRNIVWDLCPTASDMYYVEIALENKKTSKNSIKWDNVSRVLLKSCGIFSYIFYLIAIVREVIFLSV